MLDLRYVADNKDLIVAMLQDRGDDPVKVFAGADPWDLDARRREIIVKVEALRQRKNLASEEIARRGKAKEEASELKAEMKKVSDEIKTQDAELGAIETALNDLMLLLPNIPDASVPRGDASANLVVRRVGARPPSNSSPRSTTTLAWPSASSISKERRRFPARASQASGAPGRSLNARSSS